MYPAATPTEAAAYMSPEYTKQKIPSSVGKTCIFELKDVAIKFHHTVQ